MAQVNGPTPAGVYHDGRGGQLLSCTKAEPFLFRYVDPDGKESIALFYVFGEADYGKQNKPEDRMLGIWLVAGFKELNEKMKQVTKQQAISMIAMLEEKGYVHEGKLVVAAPGPVELPDVSGVFDDLMKGEAGEDPSTPE